MQKKPLDNAPCPIARSLARVGEPWSILILREAFYGNSRFDEFQKQLGIAPNMLARRLETLVREGLLARRQYCERPPRFEYLLTDRGREFRPVMLALLAWGNRHFSPEGESVQLVDRRTGATVTPILVDAPAGAVPLPTRITSSWPGRPPASACAPSFYSRRGRARPPSRTCRRRRPYLKALLPYTVKAKQEETS
ncbi:hypothetical protein OR16_03482 [Cupriavidus basilensis OR16]|uniref:HTH hxlR-type domain-containing protein n=1 Tax=Cupriavidus basilensis OR16 TaxID=1127483 RepID=H1RZF9_9BURK|nr:hypothetical protein OR16_03482 [Cupriavidus basilensis OR16]